MLEEFLLRDRCSRYKGIGIMLIIIIEHENQIRINGATNRRRKRKIKRAVWSRGAEFVLGLLLTGLGSMTSDDANVQRRMQMSKPVAHPSRSSYTAPLAEMGGLVRSRYHTRLLKPQSQ
ncbi:hypothetical protein TWF694_009677 [Orbilia ellipsospora]|uniref:Uncharacterized protein n=1 Tax=Orbilia ellipsospora TaxID=2528407 RepID=A0AAV9XBJ3_9PEZI